MKVGVWSFTSALNNRGEQVKDMNNALSKKRLMLVQNDMIKFEDTYEITLDYTGQCIRLRAIQCTRLH